LCCAGAVDCTMLLAIGTLATQQAKPTIATLKGLTQLPNCAATHPDAETCFHASDMVLHIDSDASHLSESKARSRAAGHHCLSSHPDKLQGKALSTRPTISANTIPPRVTANCALPIYTNRLLATATALTVCATTMTTTTTTLSPLPMTQRPMPFMPSPRPRAAMLRPQARVC
jgi:hypothetical protein